MSTSKGKRREAVERDLSKAGHEMKEAGKDVERAAQKGAQDVKKAGSKLRKKL
jgi:hypothetical protein